MKVLGQDIANFFSAAGERIRYIYSGIYIQNTYTSHLESKSSGPKIAANSNIPAFLLLTDQGRYIGVRLYYLRSGKKDHSTTK